MAAATNCVHLVNSKLLDTINPVCWAGVHRNKHFLAVTLRHHKGTLSKLGTQLIFQEWLLCCSRGRLDVAETPQKPNHPYEHTLS